MPTYLVEIVRTESRTKTFEVEADDREKALDLANERANDFDFANVPVDTVNYETVSLEEI